MPTFDRVRQSLESTVDSGWAPRGRPHLDCSRLLRFLGALADGTLLPAVERDQLISDQIAASV